MKIVWSIIILVIIIVGIRYFTGTSRAYHINKELGMSNRVVSADEVITEQDLEAVPHLLAEYLRYVGAVGKNHVSMFDADIDGEMRFDQTKDWAPVTVDQRTYLDQGTRLFYMAMKANGLPINGLHHFKAGKASMVIKILDLVKVADASGPLMDHAETVTYFNDLCIFAPSALLDADIVWEEIDDLSIKGSFTNEGITVSAILLFNEEGQLINFISEDRYALESDGSMALIPWSTPLGAYKDYHGYRLASQGEAIWHYPEGDFTYLRLSINDVVY